MGPRLKKFRPFTPIRRLFHHLDLNRAPRLSLSLGKRKRSASEQEHFEHDYGSVLDPIVDTPPTSPPPISSSFSDKLSLLELRNHWHISASLSTSALTAASPSKACLALQTEDKAEDAIVITALDAIPFCCHEDLLTMSREQLIKIALVLNEKLPRALEIDISPIRSASFIRNSIEILVGLRADVPGAPKPIRSFTEGISRMSMRNFGSKSSLDISMDTDISLPLSPLANRSKGYLFVPTTGSPLEPMKEEAEGSEEGNEMDVDEAELEKDQVEQPEANLDSAVPPPKKRKLYNQKLWNRRMNKLDLCQETPSPLSYVLARRNGLQNLDIHSPPLSRSRKIPISRNPKVFLDEDRKTASPDVIDTAFITTTRPRYRFRTSKTVAWKGYDKLLPGVRTSTPNRLNEDKENIGFLSPNASWSIGSFTVLSSACGTDGGFSTSMEVISRPSPSSSFVSSVMEAINSTLGEKSTVVSAVGMTSVIGHVGAE